MDLQIPFSNLNIGVPFTVVQFANDDSSKHWFAFEQANEWQYPVLNLYFELFTVASHNPVEELKQFEVPEHARFLQVPLSNFHFVSIAVFSQFPVVVLKHWLLRQAVVVLHAPVSSLNIVVLFGVPQVLKLFSSKHSFEFTQANEWQ